MDESTIPWSLWLHRTCIRARIGCVHWRISNAVEPAQSEELSLSCTTACCFVRGTVEHCATEYCGDEGIALARLLDGGTNSRNAASHLQVDESIVVDSSGTDSCISGDQRAP